MDTRTQKTVTDLIERTPTRRADYFQKKTGLPLSTYFSALKLRWLLDHVHQVKEAYAEGSLLFGTVDSWIIYVSFKCTNGLNEIGFLELCGQIPILESYWWCTGWHTHDRCDKCEPDNVVEFGNLDMG